MGKTDRLNKQIQRLAAEIILYEMSDPRIKFVTVTHAKLSEDFRYCTVYVSIFGSETEQRTTMRGLEHARNFIQRQLGDRLRLRHRPILRIEQDFSVAKSIEISKKIDEVIRQDRAAHAGEDGNLANEASLPVDDEADTDYDQDNGAENADDEDIDDMDYDEQEVDDMDQDADDEDTDDVDTDHDADDNEDADDNPHVGKRRK